MFSSQLHQRASWRPEENARFELLQPRLADVRAQLCRWHDNGTLPMLRLPAHTEDLEMISSVAADIRSSFKGLLVLGTGGSSLGGQTLCALADGSFPVWFIDNADPHTLGQFLSRDDLPDIHVLAISKSGGTVETLTQWLHWMNEIQRRCGEQEISSRCHVITVPGTSPMRELAAMHRVPVLDHDPHVGGRYSVLSLVGLLPAAVAGVDIYALRRGASAVWQRVCADDAAPALLGACWAATMMPSRPVSVLMPYADRLALFGAWYKQLWAESLGKSGKGSTPARALGAVDQHSQLQLYLDGPSDKSITFITLPYAGAGQPINTYGLGSLSYLQGFTDGDAMASLQHGTIQTVLRHHIPVRELALEKLDAEVLGGLLMHFMIETVATAQLIDVDAFDQPAVEESKQLARAYLAARRSGEAA